MERKTGWQPQWLVSRERINTLFEAGLAYPFTAVIAAPGYGKTVATMDYAGRSGRKIIRHHLLPIDNTPDCYWDRAVEAARRELPELAEEMSQSVFPETLRDFHVFLTKMTRLLFQDNEILLIYDNAENISDERILLYLESVIKAELENLSIIFISNDRPRFGPVIGEGRHLQIGPAELKFNQRETRQLFKKFGRRLGEKECAQLVSETGGWPLALHLLATHPDDRTRHAFGEPQHFEVVTELFQKNYFMDYEPDFQKLLVKLSFFDSVPLGLIQAVDPGNTFQTVDQMMRNIFISYDDSQDHLYFQKMYHDFLKRKRAMLSEAEKKAMYSKAGDWFYEHGPFFLALLCYWESRDYDQYLKALSRLPQKRRHKRSVNIVLDHLNQFPPEYVQDHESVDLYRGLLYMNDLEISRARKILLNLADRLEKQPPPSEKHPLLGDVYTALLEIALSQNNLEALDFALKAQKYAPDGARLRSSGAMVVGNNEVFFLPDKAPGRLEEMRVFIQRLAVPLKALYRKSGCGFIELFSAETAYYAQHFGAAREYGARAIFLARDAGQHDIVINSLILQLRLALYLGKYDKSEELLNKILDYSCQADPEEIQPLRDFALALFYIWLGDVARVPSWLSIGSATPTGIPMDIGRDRAICATCRYFEGRYEAAYAALLELDGLLLEYKRWSTRVSGHILKAACLYRLGNKPRAIESLWAAYDMTWANNITICFAEFGLEMEVLINAARDQAEFVFDPQWLTGVQTASAACAKRRSAMQKLYKSEVEVKRIAPDALTPRELEVMQYLANGLTRDEISKLFGVSLHGVKKHITNIYSKLGAVNRVEAIHIAKVNGILE